jgi:hypothetical protein
MILPISGQSRSYGAESFSYGFYLLCLEFNYALLTACFIIQETNWTNNGHHQPTGSGGHPLSFWFRLARAVIIPTYAVPILRFVHSSPIEELEKSPIEIMPAF